ncbi:hypothetical protein [Paenibacillus sp. BK720]|uniref:hypothetical protein n=1 Tax=Paenibacillus sp. BK720 TaxID=2587092 RepID=UPI00142440D8|nr:hypothetical protein [Paenibacillus sp. BK720]NIK68643.1 hypothetical protein [Paenibacillus sp. BK720]
MSDMGAIKNLDDSRSHRNNRFSGKLTVVIAVSMFSLILLIGIMLIFQFGTPNKRFHPPEVAFPLAEYTLFMSSVPGFPITISNNEATRIIVRSSEGDLLFWKSSDGKVNAQGNKVLVKPGETIYWSPLTEENKVQYKTIIKFTAYNRNNKLGSTSIEISSDDKYVYRGKLILE